MKKAVNTSTLLSILLVVGLIFIGCDNQPEAKKLVANAHSETSNEILTYREPLVFIAGTDDSNFYKNAIRFYKSKQFEVVTEAFSIQEILLWLKNNYDQRLYTDIYIVSKNNPEKGLQLETTANGSKMTLTNLQSALVENKFPILEEGITKETNIVFEISNLANDPNLLETLKAAFSTKTISPNIIATPFYNSYGDSIAEHYLANTFVGFYPTAHSPGKVDLAKAFAKNYPNEKEVDWYDALNNETERFAGDAFTIQYNIPIKWEFAYDSAEEEVPYFENPQEIITWIQQDEELSKEIATYNIPIEKFRWSAITKKDKLIIKGLSTVLCIVKPLIKPYGDLQHLEPRIDNLRLYKKQ